MARSVLLVNTNILRPPVSPVGLESVGETLRQAKVPLRVLDLAFEAEWSVALSRELETSEILMVGLSVRNTDDCCFATRKSFIPWVREIVTQIRRVSGLFVVLGGVGFSVMPEIILRLTGADAGIAGDGEEAMLALVECLVKNEAFFHLPNLVYWRDGNIYSNPRVAVDLLRVPPPRRCLFDNRRYEQHGAAVGVETKRGCAQRCIFCADPLAKGNVVRLRPPSTVVQELDNLVDQGVSWFHFCDSEFNLPPEHAREVCRTIIEAGLGDKIRWYCYCAPVPFDEELAWLMKRAGCAGINFGVDSLCDEQLGRLGRSHNLNELEKLTLILKKTELNYMFDLLVGGPGETEETVKTTIEQVRRLDVPLCGMAVGVRVYPGTPLGQAIAEGRVEGRLYPQGESSPGEPIFYLSPYIDADISSMISDVIAGDPRFLLLASPDEEGSYNYADDETLCRWIDQGARGAYWDIIRRAQGY